jgi:hypothetical protein
MFSTKNVLYTLIVIVFFLHNDLWFWNNPTLFLGIPIGLFYHIIYCLTASILMILLIKFAWPNLDEGEVEHNPDSVND